MCRRLLGALCLFVAVPATASAEGRVLDSLEDVHAACAEARESTRPSLYVIELDGGWRFGSHQRRAGRLPVDTRRNLLAFEGHVSIFLTGFEPLAFDADEAQAQALRTAARAGGRLRLGFFLGFDEPRRSPCVVRNRHAVTIVRADLAFAELVGSDGERLVRTDTDRHRAWRDDREELGVPGEGPRGTVGAARFSNGAAAPVEWQRALERAEVRAALAQCHAAGVARGASREGQVVVRLNVEVRTGEVRRADVALSSVEDPDEAECVARALGRHAAFGPGPLTWQAQFVDLNVPTRLVAD